METKDRVPVACLTRGGMWHRYHYGSKFNRSVRTLCGRSSRPSEASFTWVHADTTWICRSCARVAASKGGDA